MRNLLLYIILLCCWLPVNVSASEGDSLSLSPKILILNSYRADLQWSSNIVLDLEKRLLTEYPHANIHVRYMNIDVVYNHDLPYYSLRSALWSLSDLPENTLSRNTIESSIFPVDVNTDLIIIVGDDILPIYQTLGALTGKWRKVPMILCGVNDYITSKKWVHGVDDDYASLIPIEDYRHLKVFYKETEINLNDADLQAVPGVNEHGEAGYWTQLSANMTGVKLSLPIKRNLELIKSLIPELKEIVWVDSRYYNASYLQWMVEEEMKERMPGVKFSSITHNRMNTDSIFNVMFSPGTDKAYLTYSWAINGVYSKHSEDQIMSMFRNYSSVPMFSLTEQFSTHNYWIGGWYKPNQEIVDKTASLAFRVLKGEDPNAIPFEVVEEDVLKLDYELLEKYGLLEQGQSLPGVFLINKPPGFVQKYEKQIWAGIITLTILIGLFIIWVKRLKHNREIHIEYLRYKRLYDKLQAIYAHSSIDFALYNKAGKCLFKVFDEKDSNKSYRLFSENLFDNSFLDEEIRADIEQGKSINKELKIKLTSGKKQNASTERRTYQLIINPIHYKPDDENGYMVIAVNLTPLIQERKEKERIEALFSFVSDSSGVGIGYYDMKTEVGTATKSWYQNLNEPYIPGKLPVYENVLLEDKKELLAYRKLASLNPEVPHFRKNILVLGKDNKGHWVQQHAFINEKDTQMLIELNLNIDEQKKEETKLSEAKEKADQSNRETEEFLWNINHEIRTPLNAIVGFSMILSMIDFDTEEAEEHKKLILLNNRMLMMLIDDIIELSGVDANGVTIAKDPVNVKDMFAELIETGYSSLYQKELSIVTDIGEKPPIVYADRKYLQRLFVNLLSNAIKFTEEGTITLGYRKQKNEYYFYVKDTGCGIPEEDHERIFRRFQKLDSYRQGTGLGLALCKSIVTHLGGQMGVTSEKGKGSTFWFVLPG